MLTMHSFKTYNAELKIVSKAIETNILSISPAHHKLY